MENFLLFETKREPVAGKCVKDIPGTFTARRNTAKVPIYVAEFTTTGLKPLGSAMFDTRLLYTHVTEINCDASRKVFYIL